MTIEAGAFYFSRKLNSGSTRMTSIFILLFVPLSLQKFADRLGDFTRMRLQGEMTGVEKLNLGLGQIAFVSLGSCGQEERVVAAPHRQKWWPILSEVGLEIWVKSDVARVIEEEIELSLIGSRSSRIVRIEVATVVRHERCIGDTMRVLPAYRTGGQQLSERAAICIRRISPVALDGIPAIAESFFISVSIL